MKDRLKAYLESITASAADTPENHDLKEAILSNLYEKYDAMIAQGMDEEAAYRATVDSVGDVSGLFTQKEQNDSAAPKEEPAKASEYPPQTGSPIPQKKSESKKKEQPSPARSACIAIAVALYILALIPPILIDNAIGSVLLFVVAAIATGLIVGTSYLSQKKPEDASALLCWKHRRLSSVLLGVVISLYIVSVIPAILFENELFGVVPLLVIVALATLLLLLRPAIADRAYPGADDAEESSEPTDGTASGDNSHANTQKTWKKKKGFRIASSVFWTVVLLLYFIVSFCTGKWWITWIIFVLAGFLSGIFSGIYKLICGKGKAGPIVQIVICSILLVSFSSLFPLASLRQKISWNFLSSHVQFYDDSDYYSGDFSFTPAGQSLQKIDVEWTAGDVTVEFWDSDTISVTELTPDGSTVKEEDDRLRWRFHDDTLKIRTCKSARFPKLFHNDKLVKKLLIRLPEGIDLPEFRLSVVSADATLNSLSGISEIRLDSVSGRLTVNDCRADTLKADTVSGNITVSGEIADIDIDTTSGKMEINASSLLKSLNMDSTSGSVTITLPKDVPGFTLDYDSVSGKAKFPGYEISGEKSHYRYGNGSIDIDFDTVSGDITIQ